MNFGPKITYKNYSYMVVWVTERDRSWSHRVENSPLLKIVIVSFNKCLLYANHVPDMPEDSKDTAIKRQGHRHKCVINTISDSGNSWEEN